MSSSTVDEVDATRIRYEKAVICGDTETVRDLLGEQSSQVNIEWMDRDGYTAIQRACRDGNLELVKLMLSYGADHTLACRLGWNCLHLAMCNKTNCVAMYLLGYRRET